MSDLIRKSDALAAMRKHAKGKTVLGGQTYKSLTLETALDAIAALPAVTVGVKPLGADGVKIHPQDILNAAWRDDLGEEGLAMYDRMLAALEPVAAGVIHEEQNTVQRKAFWNWLPLAYRDGHLGEEAKFTKYNMEVAHYAGWCAALEPVAAPDLSDPVTVHANMLRGTIAKPTVEQIIHLYGVDALTKALAPVIVREAGIEPVAPPDPVHRPTMTDMMVDPDTLDAFMEANPLPPDPAHHVNKTLKSEHDADNTLTDPAAIREAALREAAQCAINNQDCSPWEISDAILALIQKGADHE